MNNKELENKIKQLEKERQEIIDFIEEKCVYDKHLMGYCFDLSRGNVRTLMLKLKKEEENK